jgi:hypothetical protein
MQSYNFLSATNISAVLLPLNMDVHTLHGNPLVATTVHSRITITSPWHFSRPSYLHSSAPHDHPSSWTSQVPSTEFLPLRILSWFLQKSLKTSHIHFSLLRKVITHIWARMYLQYMYGCNTAACIIQCVSSVWALDWIRPARFYKHCRTVIIWNLRSFITVEKAVRLLWLCASCVRLFLLIMFSNILRDETHFFFMKQSWQQFINHTILFTKVFTYLLKVLLLFRFTSWRIFKYAQSTTQNKVTDYVALERTVGGANEQMLLDVEVCAHRVTGFIPFTLPGTRGRVFNPLNAELNPICHLLILLGDLTFMSTCIVSIFQYISNKTQC